MACFILSCKSHSSRRQNNEKFISFHRMPMNDKNKWCHVIPRAQNYWTKHSRICSKHFTDNCFVNREDKWKRLKPGAIPTLFLDTDTENLYPNSGRELLQTMPIDHKIFISNIGDQDPLKIEETSCSDTMEVDENIQISSSSCCSALKIKIKRLECELEKSKRLCRKRFLKINALRKQTKRLAQKNSTLQKRLLEILIEENLEQNKLE